jgi:hypothetical protein
MAINRATQGATLALFVIVLAASTWGRPAVLPLGRAEHGPIPERISDADFWTMITTMSEPGGYFRSDNLVSNELTFQYVIPSLTESLGAGGVYLGVGPDQNFTYLVALRPKIAFIVDIRRGNLQQHLLYKALLELSTDRADFLSRLFSRARPAQLQSHLPVESLFVAFDSARGDSMRLRATLADVRRRLVEDRHLPLGQEDLNGMEYVLQAFLADGPSLTYSFGRGLQGYGMRGMPTYAELMVATDANGRARGYLASEANFAVLKDLEMRNLVVPLVGDFAGDKALRDVGRYLASHEATVSAIYTSNVEQYLFQGDDAWRRYYANVATLPLDDRSTFVRAVFNYGGYRDPGMPRGPRSVTMLAPVRAMLAAVNGGAVNSYWHMIQLSHSPVESAPR